MRNALLALALLVLAFEVHARIAAGDLLGDFHAFYCAGHVIAGGGDPYRAAPLYACESQAQPWHLYSAAGGVALPAPLPGYALALFVPLAFLPYPLAAILWFLVSSAAGAAAAAWSARLAGSSFALAGAAFALPIAAVCIPFGELAALSVAAFVCAALAIRRGAYAFAAAALGVAAIEPHLALPAFAACFLWQPRMRVPLATCAAVLAAVSLACGGAATFSEYFARVLPAQALGGAVSYVVMVAAGIWAVRRAGDAALAVVLPPAFALLGGTFIHLAEMVVAIPLALILARDARRPVRLCAEIALVLLAVPWLRSGVELPLIAAAAVVTFAIVRELGSEPVVALRASLLAVLAGGAIAFALSAPAAAAHAAAVHLPPDLAEASWAAAIRAHDAVVSLGVWIAKAPTWAGLIALACGGAIAAAHEDRVARIPVGGAPARR
ncbi:MAG: glycosyltransferase 87 family protein [Vulcanimicrobiaceae bacterium]